MAPATGLASLAHGPPPCGGTACPPQGLQQALQVTRVGAPNPGRLLVAPATTALLQSQDRPGARPGAHPAQSPRPMVQAAGWQGWLGPRGASLPRRGSVLWKALATWAWERGVGRGVGQEAPSPEGAPVLTEVQGPGPRAQPVLSTLVFCIALGPSQRSRVGEPFSLPERAANE